MTTNRMAPLAKFLRECPVLTPQRESLQILETLVHQVEGVVDQLGGVFAGHDETREQCDGFSELDSRSP